MSPSVSPYGPIPPVVGVIYFRIANNTILPELMVTPGIRIILPHSTVSSNSGKSSLSVSDLLPNSRIAINTISPELTINSSVKFILPQFTVNSNFGETCCTSNSQNTVFGTLYNDDLVLIMVKDSGSDESHKTLNHKSNFVQGQLRVNGVQDQARIDGPLSHETT